MVEISDQELARLRRIEAAARAYVASDPPRPEWRELTHALGDPDHHVWDHLDGRPIVVHPIAGDLHPWAEPCRDFMPDGRSDICARCDWPLDRHSVET